MTNELIRSCRITIILSSCILIFLIFLWFLIPAKSIIAGFIIGGLISFYNVFHMAYRVMLAGKLAASGSQKLVGLKTLSRIAVVIFGIILACRFPEWIDYRSLLLGLPLGLIVMIVSAGFYYIKKST
ncbi:multisubunit Na+/H+ antiporter MnhE subunit [Scopulibacillus daqui]|uniref:Multisubunit Na+/H+ antiporter MnhE subunit n=1 Tax=Scopulibacillus daqui TaxID=1469162 RepID=A0ABS2Q1G3_9BACL|nr:multisubunit Na+/H+ antiporter MnhE subunit [Scopulibacillus daqui]